MSHKNNKIKSFISNNYTHGSTGKKKITRVQAMKAHHSHATYHTTFHLCLTWPYHPQQKIANTLPMTNMPPPRPCNPQTNLLDHATHDYNHVFHPNITLTNPNSHCALATITNYLFTQATHDKPFYLCHPWQTISTITHMKKKKKRKTLDPCLHDKS